jgi:hypothetical protein
MGGLFSNTDHSHGPNSKIYHNISCPKCGKIFTKKNTYQDLYNHEKTCKGEPDLPNTIKNSPDIDKNDKQIIKSIMAENKRKKPIKDNTLNPQSIQNNLTTNSQETVNIHINTNNLYSNIINRMQNKKHSQYLSTNNQRMNPIFSNVHGSPEMFFTHEETESDRININLNFQNPKNFLKNKKFSLSSNKTISDLNSAYLKDFPFKEKLTQFKKRIQSLKVDWREGACTLNLDRDDILSQSMKQFDQINPYKELKINFKGEVSHDAGGLIREWYTVIFKELQKESQGKIQ